MLALLILALFLDSSPGQIGSSPAAAIEGVASTDGGAPLPGVKISIDSLTNANHFATQTDSAGRYAMEHLPPGSYTLVADAKGFGCVIIPKVVIESRKRLKQDFQFLRARKQLGCPTASQSKP